MVEINIFKIILAIGRVLDTFEIVLGGTTARCSIRCDGQYFFRGANILEKTPNACVDIALLPDMICLPFI
jgi:hypothetical protein